MGRPFIDRTGQTFGRLTVVGGERDHDARTTFYVCRCVCGEYTRSSAGSIVAGRTQSCGCLRRENKTLLSHGEATHATPEYRAWRNMKGRVNGYGESNQTYYTTRGITVCAAWMDSYETFLADVGRRPSPLHSLDRINNNGHYEPGNVRWATASEQMQNRRPYAEWRADKKKPGRQARVKIMALDLLR